MVDAAVAVVEAVDRRVVLVVGADGLQEQPPRWHLDGLEVVDRQPSPARGGCERAVVTGAVGEGEPARYPNPLVDPLEARHDLLDEVPDAVVVGGQRHPVHGLAPDGAVGQVADDRHLAAQVR